MSAPAAEETLAGASVPESGPAAPPRRAAREPRTVDLTVGAEGPRDAASLLAGRAGLPKARVKDAMTKGAVWLARPGRRPKRLRRASAELAPGDRLTLYYDAWLLALEPPAARLVEDRRRYSVWAKPAGLIMEGSRFGDHATLARQVERAFDDRRPVLLVHRLDLEASGLVVVAHAPAAAAALSALFRERAVDKHYVIEVLGRPADSGAIEQALDGKPARTDYTLEHWDPERGLSRVRVRMLSGRHHQIRRHFAAIGHPVMGDPKYGRGNADPRGLRLAAVRLAFADPWTGEALAWELDGHGSGLLIVSDC